MQAELRYLSSVDGSDLETYSPENPDCFRVLVTIFVGPQGEMGEESFGIVVCTPGWLKSFIGPNEIFIGRHHLIVARFDYNQLKAFIEDYVSRCTGESWPEVAEKLARLGHWEFEDYKEA